ncbi:MAG: hypothetical protein ACREXR_14150, partial [Gammaproteobacteria bacterium]
MDAEAIDVWSIPSRIWVPILASPYATGTHASPNARISVANIGIAPPAEQRCCVEGHGRTVLLTRFRMSLPHDLVTHFEQYFEILRADTPDLLEQAFRLRYQVYCQEGLLPGFDPLDYPDGLERDVYDYEHRSLHCLLRHRPTG